MLRTSLAPPALVPRKCTSMAPPNVVPSQGPTAPARGPPSGSAGMGSRRPHGRQWAVRRSILIGGGRACGRGFHRLLLPEQAHRITSRSGAREVLLRPCRIISAAPPKSLAPARPRPAIARKGRRQAPGQIRRGDSCFDAAAASLPRPVEAGRATLQVRSKPAERERLRRRTVEAPLSPRLLREDGAAEKAWAGRPVTL